MQLFDDGAVPGLSTSTKLSTSSHLSGLPQISHINTTTLDGSILVRWSAPLQSVKGYVIDYTHNGDQFSYVVTNHTSVNLSGRLHGNNTPRSPGKCPVQQSTYMRHAGVEKSFWIPLKLTPSFFHEIFALFFVILC